MTYDDLPADATRAPGCLCSAPRGGPVKYIEVTLDDGALDRDHVVELYVRGGRVRYAAGAAPISESTLLWGEIVDGA